MRAVVLRRYGGPGELLFEDVPEPVPGEGEVLIRVEAAGVNFADCLLREGRYHAGPPLPVVPGMDVAGTVAAAGPGVARLREGDRVAASTGVGGYAEYAAAREALAWPVPEGVGLEAAAAFPTVGITAYNVLVLAGRLAPGETVLVHSAAGGVGTTAAQLARSLGAGMVIGTVGERSKVEAALEAGCDHVVVRGEEDFAERVNALTGGRGADVVMDAIAGETLERGLACLAPFGRLVAFGIASGAAGRTASDQLHPTSRAVVGYSTGHHRRSRPEALQPAAEAVLGLLQEGRLRLVVGARLPLAEAGTAHELLESRRSVGKILLLP